jgi:hypothetical protein
MVKKPLAASQDVHKVIPHIRIGESITVALQKGTVPFSSDENRDSPPLIYSPILVILSEAKDLAIEQFSARSFASLRMGDCSE